MTKNIPKEIKWNNELVNKFWDYYNDKTHTYFAEAYGDVFFHMFKSLIKQDNVCIDYGCGSEGLIKALLKYEKNNWY